MNGDGGTAGRHINLAAHDKGRVVECSKPAFWKQNAVCLHRFHILGTDDVLVRISTMDVSFGERPFQVYAFVGLRGRVHLKPQTNANTGHSAYNACGDTLATLTRRESPSTPSTTLVVLSTRFGKTHTVT